MCMLKKRIIPTLTYLDVGLVKSTRFSNYRFLGDPIQAVRVYNLRDVDELIFLDISVRNQRPDIRLIERVLADARMPVTVGGGISRMEHLDSLFRAGADKVCMSTAAISNKALISSAVEKYGGQAIVISVDYTVVDGNYRLVTNPRYQICPGDVIGHIEEMASFGVSEFLITSIDRDGTMSGYDISLIQEMEGRIPAGLIANGGAGDYKDMLEVFNKTQAVAVAAASLFHFTEQTPAEARKFLRKNGVEVRK